MFWSKIWFFIVAVLAAIAFTIALVMPRPAQRAVGNEEKRRLTVACSVVRILLEDDAHKRVDLAGAFARQPPIESELKDASGAASLDETRMKRVRQLADTFLQKLKDTPRPPDFAILIDRKGRVVARARIDESDFGDVLAGRPLIDDALHGYLRDDVWLVKTTTYFVSASPVVSGTDYVGAVLLGHRITNDFAGKLVGKSLLVDVGFFRANDTIATTTGLPALDGNAMAVGLGLLKGPDLKTDCTNDINKPLQLAAGNETYSGLLARLPGEAGANGAYYGVFAKKPPVIGFSATLDVVTQDDLGFSNFPWILVGGGFLLVLGVGIALMMFEADRPLRRLAGDAVKLAKGETERLAEDAHPGKFGSIARSVNIHIDKVGREAKSAKKDLDQLLGPAPEGSLGTIDLLATALPSVRPGGAGPATPPPPSEFKFGGSSSSSGAMPARPPVATPSAPTKTPPPRPGTPPPFGATSTPPRPLTPVPAPTTDLLRSDSGATPAPSPASMFEDDILHGAGTPPPSSPTQDPYFKQVYDQFIAMKHSCNEPTSGLTYEKFSEKLTKNRDDLRAKTGCREVRFTVYVKEGKAALKATPVKDE